MLGIAVPLHLLKLSLPYSVEVACDLEQFSLVARREARRERCKRASAPQQSYVSTAKGMQDQPSSEHLTSLEACFLCLETRADDPVVTHASLRML